MDARSGFQRNYFIFVNEDTGYEAGQKPSGHIKVEVRDGRGRLHAAVQNLRPGNGRFEYALYLLRAGSIPKALVYAGNLGLRPGNTEIEWIFDPSDVGRSGVPIEGFDVFAIVAESSGGFESSPACPLAAYRNKRVDWRGDFRMSRMVKKPVQAEIKQLPKFEKKPEIKPVTKPEIKSGIMPEIKPEVKTGAKSETKPEVKPETKPEVKPETKPGPAVELQPAEYSGPEDVMNIEPTKPNEQAQGQQGTAQEQADDQPQFGAQPQIYQEASVPVNDQQQNYQQSPNPVGGQPQVYQYPSGQQATQLYGAEPEQYGQGQNYQFQQPQPYIPYPVYQEQPPNTYNPYQIYAQPPQMYAPYQQAFQQSVQPYESAQQQEDEQGQQYQEPVWHQEESMEFAAEQPQIGPYHIKPETSAQDFSEMGKQPGEPVQMAEDYDSKVQQLQENIPENIPENAQENTPENIPENMPENIPENAQENIPENIPENAQENIPENIPENIQKPQNNVLHMHGGSQQPQAEEADKGQNAAPPEYQYPIGNGNLNTECLYLNGNICGAFLNPAGGDASPCETCKANRRGAAEEVMPAGDLSRLRAILDLNFELNDPFHSKRSDYVWWKITNPVNLNNILYQNNIRSPLMFNPAVMLAHYKYRHLIVGIFTRKDGQKYVVCGVPGMHMVDRKPFGELSKWVQADGGRSRYGAFGYWLVYINPDDGKILNLNQE